MCVYIHTSLRPIQHQINQIHDEHSYQFAERLTTSGLLPPTIQTLRKLDLGALARELHLREPSSPPSKPAAATTTADDGHGGSSSSSRHHAHHHPQHPHLFPIGSPIQEGEDEDATSPILPSVGGIHGCSPSSCSSSSSSTVMVEVGLEITQPNPELLAALGRRNKEETTMASGVMAGGAAMGVVGKGGSSSRGPSRASSVVTGATDLESPMSSPALSAASSEGTEARGV